jgi:hypothetical protein
LNQFLTKLAEKPSFLTIFALSLEDSSIQFVEKFIAVIKCSDTLRILIYLSLLVNDPKAMDVEVIKSVVTSITSSSTTSLNLPNYAIHALI